MKQLSDGTLIAPVLKVAISELDTMKDAGLINCDRIEVVNTLLSKTERNIRHGAYFGS